MSKTPSSPAILVLANGDEFHGRAIGASGEAVGEVVFNTAMSGYQEILTDPSYASQFITLTHPQIGNVGVNEEDAESRKIFCAGLIIRNLPQRFSNWRAQESLSAYLKAHRIVGIGGIDTRRLTRTIRMHGAQNACLIAGDNLDAKSARKKAQAFAGLGGMDLAKVVTTEDTYVWNERARAGVWSRESGYADAGEARFNVVAYDFGVKHNILRMLAARGCRVTVLPATASADEALQHKPDGVFLSNGPGDPEPCAYAIAAIRRFLEINLPVFGICLGHQLLALAAGARTEKMKFGHHGANHPVRDEVGGRVFITSQNHGFAVNESSLPKNIRVTHRSLFDQSVQGVEIVGKPAFSFQGHPEASPGPHDIGGLFDAFINMLQQNHAAPR